MITAPINAVQSTAVSVSGRMSASSRMPRFTPGPSAQEAGVAVSARESPGETDFAVSLPAAMDKTTERRDPTNDEASDAQVARKMHERVAELNARATSVKFRVDNESNRLMVSVVSRETGETIREIPPEEVLRMQESLKEMRGILISEEH